MLNNPSLVFTSPLTTTQRTARNMVFKLISSMQRGSLTLVENFDPSSETTTERFGCERANNKVTNEVHAVIEVKHPEFYLRLLRGGSIAAGEAYMDGWWESPDLSAVMQLMASNMAQLDNVERQSNWFTRAMYKLSHWVNRNTLQNSKKNIQAHYDLGNDLYQLFLDERMLYSSALFESKQETLEQAQVNKMDRLCRQLNLSENDHVIEIGTGWGAMAIYMAQEYGCKVTTTTISEEQHQYAYEQIERHGLSDKITLLKQDYRLLEGEYDKLVSIEMIEAVGKAYLPSYIQKCHSLLKPGGLMAIQSITIADQRYDAYSNSVDFIQKYIFPGGFLPSITALLNTTTKHSGFIATNVFDMGMDYARTLKHWHQRFNTQLESVYAQGYDERFIRMWRFYLSYCEGGFLAGSISTIQLTLRKPMA